jgi:primosomal protein N' (replication factor Y) (superfamily II helicase)
MTVELQVAVATPLHKIFTYSHSEPLAPGVRVLVPFGASPKTLGVIVDGANPPSLQTPKDERSFKLKPITQVLDLEPVYSQTLLRLAQWLATYYMHPLGEVLRTMLPASAKKSTKLTFEITDAGSRAPDEDDLRPGSLFARKKTITHATLKKKLVERGLSASQIDDLLKSWSKKKWIEPYREKSIRTREHLSQTQKSEIAPSIQSNLFRELNHHQHLAVSKIINEGLLQQNQALRKPFLIFGVTGSGKTEVFLSAIKSVLEQPCPPDSLQAQALVLVPEISLTPQMTRIFEERFPGKVAVVHSAMDDNERWLELERIRRGDASVLIGPRSAVFGPFANLKLIIVDEEHDGSYKQGSGLLYNARDVAVVRAAMENATIVLGSATPSMESWQNALSGKYHLIEMPERASSKPLPDVETVAAKPAFKAVSFLQGRSDEPESTPFSDELIKALQENVQNGQQSIVLVNRRGYAYYLLCVDDRKAFGCPRCSISLSVHGQRKTLRCHYCDYRTTIQQVLADHPDKTWAVVGYGSQKAEDQLKKALPTARMARLDSDTVQDPHVLPEVLAKFRNREIDILVGTQILAKGHDFPNVTLIALLEIDQLLGLPDFRGGERTFQLLVQAAGRSGRGELPGKVIVQSLRAKHPVVQAALKQDFTAFAQEELEFRRAMGYPPYGRLILFEFNGPDRIKLDRWCHELETMISQMFDQQPDLARSVKVLGPAPAPIEIIRGRSRRTLMVLSESMQNCRAVAGMIFKYSDKAPNEIRTKIDVDPQSTL